MRKFGMWIGILLAGCGGGSGRCEENSFQCVVDDQVLERCTDGEWSTFMVCEETETCTAVGAAIGCVENPE